jgi:hypothetical protein
MPLTNHDKRKEPASQQVLFRKVDVQDELPFGYVQHYLVVYIKCVW